MPKAKLQTRKLVPINGKGMRTKRHLVFGGAFSGKVLKRANKPFSTKMARRVKELSEKYQRLLAEAGLSILPAKVMVVGHGPERELYFIQDHVPRERLLANRFAAASKAGCFRLVDALFSNLRKVMDYNEKHGRILSMDVNINNWVVLDGKPALIDFFPPRVSGEKGLLRIDIHSKESRIARIGHIALRRLAERRKLDPKKAVRRMLFDAIRARPEFEREILEKGRDFARQNFSGRGLSKLLKDLSGRKPLKQASFLGRTSIAFELRKRRRLKAKKARKK